VVERVGILQALLLVSKGVETILHAFDLRRRRSSSFEAPSPLFEALDAALYVADSVLEVLLRLLSPSLEATHIGVAFACKRVRVLLWRSEVNRLEVAPAVFLPPAGELLLGDLFALMPNLAIGLNDRREPVASSGDL
jgi:hypothetical protein